MVIEPAELTWPNGLPYSSRFGDIYFSIDGGLAETDYVFLQANRLAERFSALGKNANFTIAETGFGTGLNFLASWQLWQQARPEQAWLHFVSVEKHPLHAEDLARALALWPNLQHLAQQLLAQYPPLTAGWHRLCFAEERLTLTLLLGDAHELLPELVADVDAWFLDGFAPDKNPELWQLDLLQHVAKLSRPNTTLSTYSAAGVVRRAIEQAGFHVSKVKGFGRKRDMTTAVMLEKPSPPQSWQSRPNIKPRNNTVLIIGAGIAGVSCARALALRGWQVTIIDQADQPAAAASGNPAAIIYPKLAPAHLSAWHFQQQAYLSLLPQLRDKKLSGIWQEKGLLWLLAGNQQREGDKLATHPWPASLVRKVDAQEASAIAGVAIDSPCLYFPQAGFVQPQALCQTWLDHPNINGQWQTQVSDLRQKEGLWQALDADGEVLAQADVVILANALAARQLSVSQHLPLTPVRGQIAQIATNDALLKLKAVLCYGGYLTPEHQHHHCLGASFLPNNSNTDVTTEDHIHNQQLLATFLPYIAEQCPPINTWQGRAALRAQTTDYLPIVGALPVYNDFCQRYAAFQHGKQVNEAPVYHANLYVTLGHGSKGFCYAPLAAEIIAAELNHEPYPVAERMLNALNPARFWVKALKRKTSTKPL